MGSVVWKELMETNRVRRRLLHWFTCVTQIQILLVNLNSYGPNYQYLILITFMLSLYQKLSFFGVNSNA